MTNALIIFFKKHNLLYIIKKGSCQVLGKLTALDMTPFGWLGRKTSTQTNKLYIICEHKCMYLIYLHTVLHIG